MRASVVDIASATPKADDRFFVDTNVWRFLTYTKSTLPTKAKKAGIYADFLSKCKSSGAKLFHSPLSFSELSSIIERTELDIYNRSTKSDVNIKKFREGVKERETVVQEVNAAWGQIVGLSESLNQTLDADACKIAHDTFNAFPLDGYDVFFVEQMKIAGLTLIITDDMDFIYLPDIKVFTANTDSLLRARMFKKLIAH